MSRSPLRPATAPHTNKPPGACPHCGSHASPAKASARKSSRSSSSGAAPPASAPSRPARRRCATRPIPSAWCCQALTLYNLGYSLEETARRLKSKAGRAVSPSTIATWIGAAQRADYLPPPARRSGDNLSPRANHSLDQALSPSDLRLRLSPLEARASAPAISTTTRRCRTRFARRRFSRKHSVNLPARSFPQRRRSEGARLAGAARVRRYHRASSSTAKRTRRPRPPR